MRVALNRFVFVVATLLTLTAVPVLSASAATDEFKTSEGVTIYAYPVPSNVELAKKRPVILLFHQAGSGHGEYAPIQANLAAKGWDSIAFDLSSGGKMYGVNATVAKRKKSAPSYDDTLPDVNAAVDYARKADPYRHVILWGSSYSSGIVFQVATSRRPDVKAVIAFSPGEYLTDPHTVALAAAEVAFPVLIVEAPNERADAAPILAALKLNNRVTNLVPAHGIHGSSMLRDDKNRAGNAPIWAAVYAFLDSIKGR